MTQADLRARVRELMTSGTLPSDPPVIHRAGHAAIGARGLEGCAICGEPDPVVSYFWTGGVVVRLHPACDALWRQERDTR